MLRYTLMASHIPVEPVERHFHKHLNSGITFLESTQSWKVCRNVEIHCSENTIFVTVLCFPSEYLVEASPDSRPPSVPLLLIPQEEVGTLEMDKKWENGLS